MVKCESRVDVVSELVRSHFVRRPRELVTRDTLNAAFTLKTLQMFSVHITPEEFENGSLTLKTHLLISFTLRTPK